MAQVPFVRPTISKKDLVSVLEHLIDGDISGGETIEKFEKELGKVIGLSDRVILTNSGASALFLIFQHLNIQVGDEIILSPLSEPWVGEVIQFFGAVPIWIDISIETLQMNPEHLRRKLNPQTRVVILNHHFGYPSFMNSGIDSQEDSPLSFLKEHSQIKVIEDVTTALFTRYQNQYLGSMGDYGFTSLESNRIITTGRGGAVFVKNRKEGKGVKEMRSSPHNQKSDKLKKNQANKNGIPGQNGENDIDKDDPFRTRLDLSMSDMQAALGLSELSLAEKMIARCEQIKQFYQDSLAKSKHSFIITDKSIISNHFTFPVILQGDVNTAQKIFNKGKVEIRNIVEKTCYVHLPYLKELKNIHQLKHQVILIPIYPTLKKEEIEKITQLLNSIR